MEIYAILWREWIFFKRRFWKIVTSQIVSPILYLVTFGLGLGSNFNIEGKKYLYYILPGIIAMTSMRSAYSSISMRISVMRLHEKSFETYIYTPTSLSKLILAYQAAGAFRGVFSGVLLLLISSISGIPISLNPLFFIVLLLNSLLFSSLGFLAAILIDTHYDLNRFTTFIITPMSFLCGIFFSLKTLPLFLKVIIKALPLSHSVSLLRSIYFKENISYYSLLILIFYIVLIYIFNYIFLKKDFK